MCCTIIQTWKPFTYKIIGDVYKMFSTNRVHIHANIVTFLLEVF